MGYETHEQIADGLESLDVNWHAVAFDSSGVSIEWYTDDYTVDEMRELLEHELDRQFEIQPLDGGTELTYQYHIFFE